MDTERFYREDNRDYDLKNNKTFLVWFYHLIKKGYVSFIGVEELQNLVDFITIWYEIKYPERDMESSKKNQDFGHESIDKMSDIMDINQLLYRLTDHQKFLLKGCYRSNILNYYDHDSICASIPIEKKDVNEQSFVQFDCYTGKVLRDHNINKIVNGNQDISIVELKNILDEKYFYDFDYTDLNQCILNHYIDSHLRDKVLQIVALKLLYSINTTPERGYSRAKRFIGEFNKKLDLTLSCKEIDSIMDEYHSNICRKKK